VPRFTTLRASLSSGALLNIVRRRCDSFYYSRESTNSWQAQWLIFRLFNDATSTADVIRGSIQKFPDWVDNEIYAYNNENSLRSNTKGYGGKTLYTDSQNCDTTASSGREFYHLQFSLQEASPETFGYSVVFTPHRRYYCEASPYTECD